MIGRHPVFGLASCALVAAALSLGWGLLAPAFADQDHLFGILDKVERSYRAVHDYTTIFRKQERIGEELRPEETAFLKFQKPFKVYLRWLSAGREGREALYVEGSHRNKVLIYEPHGIARFFTFLIDPGGWRVLEESRYPFTDIGIGRLIERIARDARRARAKGELRLKDLGVGSIQGREVLEIEGILPRDPQAGYESYRTRLSIDRERWLPLRASIYDWDDRVIGTYAYTDLKLNPGLKDADFDPSNPAYNFPRWRIWLGEE